MTIGATLGLELAAIHRDDDWRGWGLCSPLYIRMTIGGILGLEMAAIHWEGLEEVREMKPLLKWL